MGSQKQSDFMGSLVTEYNPKRPSEWVKQDVVDEYKKIRTFLQEHGGKQWMEFVKRFEEEEVKDSDLLNLSDDDLKDLIFLIGPRNRFKKWVDAQNPVHEWIGLLK